MFYSAGAVIIRKQKKLIELFNHFKAVNAESAVSLEKLGIRENFIFYRMVQRNIFVQVESGNYYINNHALAQYNEQRRKTALIIIALLLIVFVLYSLDIIK